MVQTEPGSIFFEDYSLDILGLYLYRTAEDMKGEREGE